MNQQIRRVKLLKMDTLQKQRSLSAERRKARFLSVILSLVFGSSTQAGLIVNNPQPITQWVTMQPIVVSDNDGLNTATYFGNALQQSTIFSLVDQIWAQASIDVEWLPQNSYSSTFANIGSATTTVARPTADLSTIITAGDAAGVGNADPLIIDIYFLQAAAGFSVLSLNSVAGLAFVGGNGITAYLGSNLLGSDSGLEAIAGVIAHEIGHNLGLPHITEAENLMMSGDSDGARLNASQVTTALNSSLSTTHPVPEPAATVVGLALLGLGWLRRRRGA